MTFKCNEPIIALNQNNYCEKPQKVMFTDDKINVCVIVKMITMI